MARNSVVEVLGTEICPSGGRMGRCLMLGVDWMERW
jgi:hypothetical protein